MKFSSGVDKSCFSGVVDAKSLTRVFLYKEGKRTSRESVSTGNPFEELYY